MNTATKRTKPPQVVTQTYKERELFQRKRPQKDDKEENVSHHRTLVTKNERTLRDRHGMSDVQDVTIVTRKSTDVPPPPPMPTSESESSNSSWKSSSPALSATSATGRPPSCPTPDYDTSSSSSVSSPAESLSTGSKNPAHHGKLYLPSYTSINTGIKPMLNPQSRLTATNSAKNTTTTTTTSQTIQKNADTVEMQSIESFRLKNPQSPKPKPPETYFVPVRSKKKAQNSSDTNQLTWREEQLTGKQRPVSITIGEYPSGVERRIPTRFDFLSTNVTDVRKPVSSVDSSNITCQLQSELAQTLSRSNLRKQTDSQVPLQNEISKDTASAKGNVTISVNCQHPIKNVSNARPSHGYISSPQDTNGANKIRIESNNNPRSKVSVVSTERKTQVSQLNNPTIQTIADKIGKSLETNSRMTITVPSGVQLSE